VTKAVLTEDEDEIEPAPESAQSEYYVSQCQMKTTKR